MKTKTIIGGLLLTMVVTVSSCNKELDQQASIGRDCGGTYLSVVYNQYKVCNPEKLAHIATSTAVEVDFKILRKCDGSGDVSSTCESPSYFDAWVEVIDVK